MKKTNVIFWTTTGLFSIFMLFASIPDALLVPEAHEFMQHLGYPDYFTRLIGVSKIVAVIGILFPGLPRVKEWAYAGFFYDLAGATYSQIASDGYKPQVLIMLLPIGLMFVSYVYFRKRLEPMP